MSNNSLAGKVALVNGGPRGVGRAICLALAEAGATVAVHYNARFVLASPGQRADRRQAATLARS